MNRVEDKELDMDRNQRVLWKGKPFTGIAYEEGDSYIGLSEISYRNGIEDGLARDWYSSGQLKAEDSRLRGIMHGMAREWSEDGKLLREAEYEYNLLVYEKRWDTDGNLSYDYQINKNDLDFQEKLQAMKTRFEKTSGTIET